MRMRVGFPLLVLLIAGLFASSASASVAVCQKGTTSWTATDGGTWKNPDNWSNGVPSANCDAKITVSGDYGVAVGRTTDSAGVARSLTIGGASGKQTLVDDNSTCGVTTCTADPRVVVGAGGIRVNANGAIKMYAGNVSTTGRLSLVGGRLYGVGAVTARRGVSNIGGLLVLGGNGVINITGSYSQDARAAMTVGVPPDGSDETPGGLSVTGMVSLDGKLRVNGSAPARPAPFYVIVAGKGLFGTFSGIAFDDQEYAPIYAVKGFRLGPVPEAPDTTDPVLSNVRFQPAAITKQAVLSFRASEVAKVDLRFERYPVVRPVTVRVVQGAAGANSYQLSAKPLGLTPGKYRLTLTAVDPAGNTSIPVTLIFTVRKG